MQNDVAIPSLVWFCGHEGGDRAWNARVQTSTWQVCQDGPEHGYLLFPQFDPQSKAETGTGDTGEQKSCWEEVELSAHASARLCLSFAVGLSPSGARTETKVSSFKLLCSLTSQIL